MLSHPLVESGSDRDLLREGRMCVLGRGVQGGGICISRYTDDSHRARCTETSNEVRKRSSAYNHQEGREQKARCVFVLLLLFLLIIFTITNIIVSSDSSTSTSASSSNRFAVKVIAFPHSHPGTHKHLRLCLCT